MATAGNGKKKMGNLKGYKCFTRTNKSGVPYTTCKDDEEQLRIASAKKKKELYKKPTKPTTQGKKRKFNVKKSPPKPKKPRGRPKAPPKVKKAPAKRGRPSTGKMDARKAEADKKRKARLEKKYKVMTPTTPKRAPKKAPPPKKEAEDTDDDDSSPEMVVQEIELTKNKDGVPWRGKNVYVNETTNVIYDPANQDIVGKQIIVVKGEKRQTMYKITDKDFALRQQKGETADLRFFGR